VSASWRTRRLAINSGLLEAPHSAGEYIGFCAHMVVMIWKFSVNLFVEKGILLTLGQQHSNYNFHFIANKNLKKI
jgi:hypothetical protein